jgi:hypothetical protein
MSKDCSGQITDYKLAHPLKADSPKLPLQDDKSIDVIPESLKQPSPKSVILLVFIDVKLVSPLKQLLGRYVIPNYTSSSNDVMDVLFLNIVFEREDTNAALVAVIPVPSPY